MSTKLYQLTPEHKAQLPAWRDRWIANAFRTKPLTEDERAKVHRAILGMYAATKKLSPPRVVFVPSPFVGAFSAGFAGGRIWLNAKNKDGAKPWPSVPSSPATISAIARATQAASEAAPGSMTVISSPSAPSAPSAPSKKWHSLGGCTPKDISELADLLGDSAFLLELAKNAHVMLNGGNQWSGWVAYLSFFRHVAKLNIDYSSWDHYETAAIAGPRWVHRDFCVVSDPPVELRVNERNQPHCNTGPFCRWADGSSLYAIDGVRIPGWIVDSPGEVTIEAIRAETNAEVRRVMRGQFGEGRYLAAIGAKIVDVDSISIQNGAIGPSIERALLEDDEGRRFLVGSDGSTPRVYYMEVDQKITTCRTAHEFLAGCKEDKIVAQG